MTKEKIFLTFQYFVQHFTNLSSLYWNAKMKMTSLHLYLQPNY